MDYKPTGVCSRLIHVELDGDKIANVEFVGGCAGNTSGISSRPPTGRLVSFFILVIFLFWYFILFFSHPAFPSSKLPLTGYE